MIWEWLKAFLYGLIEGVTEWLPVSSTGHLILFESLLPFAFSDDAMLMAEFGEMFEVVIQLGAILAVVLLMREKLFPKSFFVSLTDRRNTVRLWGRLLVASFPAALIGILGDRLLETVTGKSIDGWLYNAVVVAVALIVYGIAFLWTEQQGLCDVRVDGMVDISIGDAFRIGCFQTLSLVPGTSRSGATVLGARVLGFSRTAAAEFSFLMAVPVMLGASAVKMLGFISYLNESNTELPLNAWAVLLIGSFTAFGVSLLAIRFLMDFVKKHSFAPFGVYRIFLGAVVLLWWFLRS